MSGERLTGSDKRALLLWVLLGVVGAVFAHKYFFRAFPEASVDFKVSRGEALTRAQNFVRGLGEDVSGYQTSIVFDVDENAKTYLERELGLEQANRMMASELSIWYWDVRFFRPQQEEEFHVRVSPAGGIVGYDHKVEEAQAGAALDRAAAEIEARQFLTSKLDVDLSGWGFLPEEVNSTKRPKRLDWTFTWEKRDFRAKDAPYRLHVNLDGEHVGGADQYLQVPEAWKRSYQRLRDGNDKLTLVFAVPYLLLIGAAIWLAITLTRRGETSWGGAIKLGVVAASLLFLQSLNDWPLWAAGYDTNSSYSSFLASKILLAILMGIVSALTITLVLPAAEPLYRSSQPGQMRISEALTLRGLRSKEFLSASVVGLSMAAAHIGFLVLFYMVATRLGAWAPQELNYENSVSTTFPWVSGIAIGLYAATNEEFTFRLFAIPFLQKLTRSRWIAVILPAFLWSFLHSNYPQQPAYIRGIEVGIIGIVAGLVMLRWGILATLIWHYTVDASLVGLFLIRSNSLYFKISGVVVGAAALAPLAFAGFSYLMRGRFETDEDLLNSAQPAPAISFAPVPAAAEVTGTPRRYDALSGGTIGFLVLCLLAGGLLAWRLKTDSIGDDLKLSVNARSAKAQADAVLKQRGLDPRSYYHAAVLADVMDPVTNEFLRERLGIARTNDIYATLVPGVLWRVRYFRDNQTEEYAVILKPDGSLHAVRHALAEEAPGASLTKEEARALSEKFLREEKKLDLSQWTLVEASSDKRPKRTDHKLTWEQTSSLDPESVDSRDASGRAHARFEVEVLGDEVANYRTYIKIPEEWRRKQEARTLPRTLFTIGSALLFVALGLAVLILFLKRIRSEAAHAIPWRLILLWASWGLVGYAVVCVFGNRFAMLLSSYQTANSLKLWFGVFAISVLLGAAFNWGGLALLFGLSWCYAKKAFGEERIPRWTGMPSAYYRDALWIGLGGTAALLSLHRLLDALGSHWHTMHRVIESSLGGDFDATLPAAFILGAVLLRSLFYTGLVALLSSFLGAELRARWLRLLLFGLSVLALVGVFGNDWGSPADLAKQFLAQLILLGVIVIGMRRIMRFNILGCFLVVAGSSLLSAGLQLVAQPDAFYRTNGYAVLLALALLLGWPLVAWRMRTTGHAA